VSEPFIGEIRLVGWTFEPRGWSFCNGQTMQINVNQALFSLLGTTYGGNGVTTFALPDLRDRVPVHAGQRPGGSNFTLGQAGGEASHPLTTSELPPHVHVLTATSATGSVGSPNGNVPAVSTKAAYGTSADVAMGAGTVGNTGASQPHENMPPFLAVNFVIALTGIFPSRG
jgi:microcystin-dependent protein